MISIINPPPAIDSVSVLEAGEHLELLQRRGQNWALEAKTTGFGWCVATSCQSIGQLPGVDCCECLAVV
ncbi:alpha-toxin [Anopheles sinensis]|uniref:Alpha-toxin n=1 Tax=Anopheles sinensis TaxID=74873 RepID=A0A084WAW7_ANOSI|nr:alpha-toxin [Anopheles sinensis]